jgi:hypothetical protein
MLTPWAAWLLQGVPHEIVRLLRTAPPGTFDSAMLAGVRNARVS